MCRTRRWWWAYESRVWHRVRGPGRWTMASAPWETVASSLRYMLDASFHPASEFVFASPYVPRSTVAARLRAAEFRAGPELSGGGDAR